MPRQLVVLTGPIASGKTTVAMEVASEARRRGQTAAAIDIDDLVGMIADWGSVTPDDWLIAREVAAQIAETLFLHEIETVIINGPFFSEAERQHLLKGFAIEPPTLFVMLRVSLAESMRRIRENPTGRVLTLAPAFVEKIYATIDWDNLPAQDVDLDTDGLSLDEVVAAVAEHLLR